MPRRHAWLLLFLPAILAAPAAGQVFDLGPSDPALFDVVIDLPPASNIGDNMSYGGNGSTTQINVSNGRRVGHEFIAGSGTELNLLAGELGAYAQANAGSEINVVYGEVALGLHANAGSAVTISDGSVDGLQVYEGSSVSIHGGDVEFEAHPDSVVQVTGGSVSFDTHSGSRVNVSGGQISDFGSLASDSEVNMSGGTIPDNARLTNGTFNISGGTVGERLWAHSGVVVNISGGEVGEEFQSGPDSVVNISGGVVGHNFDAENYSTVNISGGTVLGRFQAQGTSVVNVSGGLVGATFYGDFDLPVAGTVSVAPPAVMNVSGGLVAEFAFTTTGTVNISGGTVGASYFIARDSSTVNFFGAEFVIDGDPVDDLAFGETMPIVERDVTLTGVLADGTPVDYALNSVETLVDDFFDPEATVTITLVSQLPGDFNNDGLVDAADYTVWRDNVGEPAGTLLNDVDGGVIGAAQYATWHENFGAVASAGDPFPTPTPEPTALALLLIAGLGFHRTRL